MTFSLPAQPLKQNHLKRYLPERWQLNIINLIIKALVCCISKAKEKGKKTSMCLSWSGAPEVLTNLWWPVYALPPLIAPCISVWCESSHCSERPVGPQRSHTFIITLYCRTLYGHSAPNSLPVKNRAFSSPSPFGGFSFNYQHGAKARVLSRPGVFVH